MKGTMKAAVLHAPGVVRFQEVPIPAIGAGEVLLRIRAAGNCGSDLKRIMVEGTWVFPCIPGHEFSGEVSEVGEGVDGYSVGDRVTAAPMLPCFRCEWCLQGQYNLCDDYDYVGSRSDGAFAEYLKIRAFNLVKLPQSVSDEAAAMTDPAGVALHALRRAGGVGPGEVVAVLGAGPIGMFACQWAALMGAGKVIATDIFDEKLEIARGLGVPVCINSSREDTVKRIMEETVGKGADLIVETAGSVDTHRQALLAARKRGRIVHVGRAYTDVLLADEVFTKIFRRELAVFGAVNTNFSPHDNEWRTTVDYLASGALRAEPLVSHRLPMSEVGETFQKMFRKEMVYNKVIFRP
jgi:L-iditol 2-dehydrogenase